MNPKNPKPPTSLRQEIEDNQKVSLERQKRDKVVAEAMSKLCCPADAAGKMIKEIITTWDRIRIIFDDGMQMILSAEIEQYDRDAEVMVNRSISVIDLVEFGLLPKSVADEAKTKNLIEEREQLLRRLEIIDNRLTTV